MTHRLVLATVLTIAFTVPLMASAQSSDAHMRAAIRARLMEDPRSSQMSQAEIDATVDALAAGAEKQGMTSDQVAPASAAPAAPEDCNILCAANRAFGFDGSSPIVPVAILAITGLLGFLLYELKRHIHVHGHIPLQ